MDSIQANKQFIQNAVQSQEFDKLINKAAPYRVKIDTDYRREMKEVKDMFISNMAKSDPKLIEILKKNRKDRSEEDVEYYNAKIKSFSKAFQAVKKVIHPNKGTSEEAAQNMVNRIAEVVKILNYIGFTGFETAFANVGMKVEVPTLESENSFFDSENERAVLADIFQQADEVQGQICQAADEIKINIFREIPDHIRFDTKQNKQGIKPPAFQKLVKTKAVQIESGNDKVSKFKKMQIKKNENEIVARQIEVEKTKEI